MIKKIAASLFVASLLAVFSSDVYARHDRHTSGWDSHNNRPYYSHNNRPRHSYHQPRRRHHGSYHKRVHRPARHHRPRYFGQQPRNIVPYNNRCSGFTFWIDGFPIPLGSWRCR